MSVATTPDVQAPPPAGAALPMSRNAGRLLLAPSVIVLLAWMIVPLVMTLWFSFQYYNLINPETTGFAGLDNYRYLVTDPDFWVSLQNTLILLASVPLGFLLGLFRMLVDTPVTLGIKPNGYDVGTFFWVINNINFQYFSILITAVSAIVMVGVSYLTPAPDYEALKDLTFATRSEKHRADSQVSWGWKEVTASVVVLIVVAFGYLYFTG